MANVCQGRARSSSNVRAVKQSSGKQERTPASTAPEQQASVVSVNHS